MNKACQLTARDIMSLRYLKLRPEMDIYEAVDLLLSHRMANAPVVDEAGHLVGFLSEKDCMETLLDGAYSSNPSTNVENCMSRSIKTVHEDVDVLTIAELFLNTAYRRLPVVRGQQLVGLISRRDFMQAMAEMSRIDKPDTTQPRPLYLSNVSDRSSLPMG
ncbi:CBS domain-containing protein [bacterium]|jgi:CBS domain-containing protein|nr:CBS domain-containing protein [bacterium]